MIGIVIASHGQFAEGLMDTCRCFFPQGLPQMKSCVLRQEDDPLIFQDEIENAIFEVNTGEGVIVLCDLLGGTPANSCTRIMMKNNDPSIQFIAGLNLSLLLELLGLRLNLISVQDLNISELLELARKDLVSLNQRVMTSQSFESDFIYDQEFPYDD